MLPTLRSIRQLHCGPRELVRRQLALIHARIHGSNEFRDLYVPEWHHRRVLSQRDHHGRVPVIGVDARSVEDIQAAVTFVLQQKLKLVGKNTG